MKTIIFKKKWVAQLDNMHRVQREKCVIALYDFLFHGRLTPPSFMGTEVREFMKEIAEEVKRDEERREKARQRREERRRQQAETQALQQAGTNDNQPDNIKPNDSNNDDYKSNPSLYMFDGFAKYMLSYEGKKQTPEIPAGESLTSILQRYRRWIVTKARSTEISKFNVFRDLLTRNMSDIMSVSI